MSLSVNIMRIVIFIEEEIDSLQYFTEGVPYCNTAFYYN